MIFYEPGPMKEAGRKDTIIQMKVTDPLEHAGRFHLIVHMPARAPGDSGRRRLWTFEA